MLDLTALKTSKRRNGIAIKTPSWTTFSISGQVNSNTICFTSLVARGCDHMHHMRTRFILCIQIRRNMYYVCMYVCRHMYDHACLDVWQFAHFCHAALSSSLWDGWRDPECFNHVIVDNWYYPKVCVRTHMRVRHIRHSKKRPLLQRWCPASARAHKLHMCVCVTQNTYIFIYVCVCLCMCTLQNRNMYLQKSNSPSEMIAAIVTPKLCTYLTWWQHYNKSTSPSERTRLPTFVCVHASDT